MINLNQIEQELDQKIDETLLALRIEAVVNTLIDLEENKKHLKDGYFNISTHEKSMRKSFFYEPYECFNGSFDAKFDSYKINKEVNFKQYFKEFFIFGMTYRGINFELSFSSDCAHYDANHLLNELVNKNFFEEARRQSSEDIFNKVIQQLKEKNQDVTSYKYQAKITPKEETYTQQTQYETKEDLFNALNEVVEGVGKRKLL